MLGDLYEPLGDERFDAILANPPFVPWPAGDTTLLFRGGGSHGDDVFARILAGAPARLDPLGSLAVVAGLVNADSLAANIREWQHQQRCTLILLQRRYELLEYAETHAAHHDSVTQRQEHVVRLLEHFQRSGIRTLDFGYVIQDGIRGDAHLERTAAPLTANDFADAVLELAPGLRLVDVTERAANGAVTTTCYVAPGPASLHEPSAVTPRAFARCYRSKHGPRACYTAQSRSRENAGGVRLPGGLHTEFLLCGLRLG